MRVVLVVIGLLIIGASAYGFRICIASREPGERALGWLIAPLIAAFGLVLIGLGLFHPDV